MTAVPQAVTTAFDWMEVAGAVFEPANPAAYDYPIRSIALGLSRESRYNGHTPGWPWPAYSVAQHSVLVSRRVAELAQQAGESPLGVTSAARQGLLHDASEAFLKDLTRAVKRMCPDYQRLEAAVMGALCKRHGVPYPMTPLVKLADEDLLATEAAEFFPEADRPRPWNMRRPALLSWLHLVRPLPPDEARGIFLERWEQLELMAVP